MLDFIEMYEQIKILTNLGKYDEAFQIIQEVEDKLEYEKILQQIMATGGENGLRMKLNTVNFVMHVFQTHDFVVTFKFCPGHDR